MKHRACADRRPRGHQLTGPTEPSGWPRGSRTLSQEQPPSKAPPKEHREGVGRRWHRPGSLGSSSDRERHPRATRATSQCVLELQTNAYRRREPGGEGGDDIDLNTPVRKYAFSPCKHRDQSSHRTDCISMSSSKLGDPCNPMFSFLSVFS